MGVVLERIPIITNTLGGNVVKDLYNRKIMQSRKKSTKKSAEARKKKARDSLLGQ